MRQFWRMMFVLLLGTGLVLGGFPAVYGQGEEEEAEEKEVFTLEEMVITAAKREQELIEVPMAVMAFTGDYMEQRGIDSFQDIVDQLPGVHLGYPETGANTEQGSKIYFRGTAISGAGKMASAPTSFYIDEVSLNFPNSPYSPPINAFYDVERVEVLYGPSGSLYGQGAFGGTMKVITKEVDLESYGGKAQIDVSDTDHGSRTNYSLNAVVNAPVIKDKFGLRLITGNTFRGSIGDVTGGGYDNLNESDITALRVKALLKLTDTLSIGVSHWVTRFTQDMYYGEWQDSATFTLPQPITHFPQNNSQTSISDVTIRWGLPFADLVSSTGFADGFQSQEFGTYQPPYGEWGYTGGQDREGWSHETRLVSNQDQPLKWIGGFYYGQARTHDIITGFSDYPPDPESGWDLDMINESTMKAVFGEVSYDFLDGDLTVLGGLRWYEEEREAVGLEEGARTGMAEKTFDDLSPRFNIAYYPTEDGMFYVNVAKGTRAGLINLCEAGTDADNDPSNGCQNEHLVNAGWTRDTQIIDEDTIWSYEIGTKWALLDGALTVMASGYYNKWSDFQGELNFRESGLVWVQVDGEWVQLAGAAQNAQFTNIGDLNLWGAQMQLSWRPVPSIGIDWSGSWNKGEWGDVVNFPEKGLFSGDGAEEGADVVGSAEWTSNLSVSYATTFGDYDLFVSASWAVDAMLSDFGGTTITYNTDSLSPDDITRGDPADAVENREDVSLSIGVSRGRWSALLYADNLLNEDDPINGGSSLDPAHGYLPHPRTIGLRVSIDFGGEMSSKGPMATMPGGRMGK